MKLFVFGFLLAHAISTNACLEPAATVYIQNYEGPIYVSDRSPICDNRPPTYNNCPPTSTNCQPTCNSYSPMCPNCPPTGNSYSPMCPNCPPTLTNPAPSCTPTVNYLPCDNQSPQIIHIPYSVCETDCKCITKLTPNVPCNSAQPNPGTYYYQYPDCGYYSESDLSCPRIGEIVPLIKTLLSQNQNKCTKTNCQCGNQQYQ